MGGKLVQEIVAFLSTGAPFAVESLAGLFAAPIIALLVCATFILTIGYCFKSLEKNPVIYTAGLLFSLGAGWLVVYEFCRCVPHPRDLYLDVVKSMAGCGTGFHFDEKTKQCVSGSSASSNPLDKPFQKPLALDCPAASHYDAAAGNCVSDARPTSLNYLKDAAKERLRNTQSLQDLLDGSPLTAKLLTRPICEPGKRYSVFERRCVTTEPSSLPTTSRPFDKMSESVETPGELLLRNMTTRDVLSGAICGLNQHRDLKTFLCVDNAAPAPLSPTASGRAPEGTAP